MLPICIKHACPPPPSPSHARIVSSPLSHCPIFSFLPVPLPSNKTQNLPSSRFEEFSPVDKSKEKEEEEAKSVKREEAYYPLFLLPPPPKHTQAPASVSITYLCEVATTPFSSSSSSSSQSIARQVPAPSPASLFIACSIPAPATYASTAFAHQPLAEAHASTQLPYIIDLKPPSPSNRSLRAIASYGTAQALEK